MAYKSKPINPFSATNKKAKEKVGIKKNKVFTSTRLKY